MAYRNPYRSFYRIVPAYSDGLRVPIMRWNMTLTRAASQRTITTASRDPFCFTFGCSIYIRLRRIDRKCAREHHTYTSILYIVGVHPPKKDFVAHTHSVTCTHTHTQLFVIGFYLFASWCMCVFFTQTHLHSCGYKRNSTNTVCLFY